MKERLIGAAVLVVLGVWLIPWVLDGPPQTEGSDERGALDLPVLEAEPLRRETIELDAARRAGPGRAGATPAETPAATARADTSAPAESSAESEVTAASETPARSEPQVRTPAAAAPRPTAPAPAARAAPAPANADTWMVQLGSFGDEANARRLADRVKTFGHDAQIAPFSAGARTMYRVRVGSFETRRQAEATASSLSAHGFPAQIVAPE